MKFIELPCGQSSSNVRRPSEPLYLADALLLESKPFEDFRGSFEEVWDHASFLAANISFHPGSSAFSYNIKTHTLRGLHFQKPPHGQAKVVTCVHGRVWDVIADLRPNSSTYLCWASNELYASSGRAVYIPAGFAHGFLTLTEYAVVAYLIDGDYIPESSGTIRWNDPVLGINWPTNDPILSERDRLAEDYSR